MRHVIRYTLLTLICLGLVLALLTGLVLGALQYRVHANLQRYEDRPKVTGLPADWPGNRDFQPYQGPHPSQMETPADPVSYPLPLGSVGPVAPLRSWMRGCSAFWKIHSGASPPTSPPTRWIAAMTKGAT